MINPQYVDGLEIRIQELESERNYYERMAERRGAARDKMCLERDAARNERDALAAQIEQFDTPAMVFIENVQETTELLLSMGPAENIVALTRDLTEAADNLEKALDATSLARKKLL